MAVVEEKLWKMRRRIQIEVHFGPAGIRFSNGSVPSVGFGFRNLATVELAVGSRESFKEMDGHVGSLPCVSAAVRATSAKVHRSSLRSRWHEL